MCGFLAAPLQVEPCLGGEAVSCALVITTKCVSPWFFCSKQWHSNIGHTVTPVYLLPGSHVMQTDSPLLMLPSVQHYTTTRRIT